MEKFKVKVGNEWVSSYGVQGWVSLSNFESSAIRFDVKCIESVKSAASATYPESIIEFIPVATEKQPESNPKELDLCEILKDAPKGLKLWSVIYGEVKFENVIDKTQDHPVIFKSSNGHLYSCARNGVHDKMHQGECTLFPSKENRDWSTFKLPYKLPVKGELCWTMSSVGNWIPRFATGEINNDGKPLFFCDQNPGNPLAVYSFTWQPLLEIPAVFNGKLKLK